MRNLALNSSLSSSFAEILQGFMQNQSVPKEATLQEERATEALERSSQPQERALGLESRVLEAVMERFAKTQDEIIKTFDKLFPGALQSKASFSASEVSAQEFILGRDGTTTFAAISQRSLSFSLEGVIRNGTQEQSVSLEITLQESFVQTLRSRQSSSTALSRDPSEKLKLIDPLVIDYLGVGTELSDQSFSFDLDSDGTPDQISRLKQGSGFLALDKNQDGIINDGNELFGTKSGNGFADLALHDKNRDGKIDKNDPIYENLRIWTPLKNGDSRLIALGEAGIGALYLNPKKSEKLMQGAWGNTLGIRRQSAAFERLDGSRGEVHHIDFAKLEKQRNEQDSLLRDRHLLRYHTPTTLGTLPRQAPQESPEIPFPELWQTLNQRFAQSHDSHQRLLDELIFGGRLREVNEESFIQSTLARARALLR